MVEGRHEARGGLEPWTDRRAPPAGGPRDGRRATDIRPHPVGPRGRRKPVDAPPSPGKEAEPEGWPPRGPGSHPGTSRCGRGKARTGGREADTVIGGGHGGAVVSPVDGCPEQPLLRRVDGKRAEVAGKAPADLPKGPGARVHTITAASGKGLAERAKVAKALEADFLLPTPHHPWERGLNGHTNGPPPRPPAEGEGSAPGHGHPCEGGPGHPERASARGPRPSDAGGGVRPGAASPRLFVPGLRRGGVRHSGAGRRALWLPEGPVTPGFEGKAAVSTVGPGPGRKNPSMPARPLRPSFALAPGADRDCHFRLAPGKSIH